MSGASGAPVVARHGTLAVVRAEAYAGPVSAWWLACPEGALPPGTHWLTEAELAYADSKRFTKRRSEFLLARHTAKTAVAQVLGIDALHRVQIRHEPSGAPFVWVDDGPAPLRLSMTDRAGWAVCLVSDATGRIGCDLELVEPRSDGFVDDWLTPAEQDHVRAAPDEDARRLAANLIWSAKESALKVLTTGLRRDTRSVEISVGHAESAWQPLTATAADGPAMPGWWRRFGGWVLTLAGEQPADAPAALGDEHALTTAEPRHSWMTRPVVG